MWSTKDLVGGRQRDRETETERQRDRGTEGQRGRGTEGQRIEKHQVRSRLVELRGEGRKNREESTIIFFCKGWLRGLKPMP